MTSTGARLAAATLYVGVLLAYAYWRAPAEKVPSAVVELAVIMVPSLVLGFVLRSWWALIVPLVVDGLIWVTLEGAGRLDRLDLFAYLLVITLPPAWFAAGTGVLASRVAERYL